MDWRRDGEGEGAGEGEGEGEATRGAQSVSILRHGPNMLHFLFLAFSLFFAAGKIVLYFLSCNSAENT